MPTATLKSPRTLNKYGRKWVKDQEVFIDFKEYKKMEGDPRFAFGGVKITTEADPDEVAPEAGETKPAKQGGRTRTKVSDVVPPASGKKAAKKTAGVKIVKKGAAAPATEPAKEGDTSPPAGDSTPPTNEGDEDKGE